METAHLKNIFMVRSLYGFTGFDSLLMDKIPHVILSKYSISINKLLLESMTDLSSATCNCNLKYKEENQPILHKEHFNISNHNKWHNHHAKTNININILYVLKLKSFDWIHI